MAQLNGRPQFIVVTKHKSIELLDIAQNWGLLNTFLTAHFPEMCLFWVNLTTTHRLNDMIDDT